MILQCRPPFECGRGLRAVYPSTARSFLLACGYFSISAVPSAGRASLLKGFLNAGAYGLKAFAKPGGGYGK